MKENKIVVTIKRPIEDVFEFTINPKNTHLWISSIKEEKAEKFPPEIGTMYKNTGDGVKWNYYEVIEFQENKLFTLRNLEDNYRVRYSYRKIDENTTELEYLELVEHGELENPFTEETLNELKIVMEK